MVENTSWNTRVKFSLFYYQNILSSSTQQHGYLALSCSNGWHVDVCSHQNVETGSFRSIIFRLLWFKHIASFRFLIINHRCILSIL